VNGITINADKYPLSKEKNEAKQIIPR